MCRSWPAAQFLVPSVPTGFEPHAVSCWGGSRSVLGVRGEWLDENFSMARSMVGFDEVFGGRIKTTHPETASVQVRGHISGWISSWIVYTSECIDMAFGDILADSRGLCVAVLRCSAGSSFACTRPIRAGVVGVIGLRSLARLRCRARRVCSFCSHGLVQVASRMSSVVSVPESL